MRSMLRYILSGIFLLILGIACQNGCEENAPQPLSFSLQWVDNKGTDIFKSKNYDIDSLTAFYKGARENISVKLDTTSYEEDGERLNIIDMMPLVRSAFSLQLDTVFVGLKSSYIDTVVLKVVREDNECFSTIYSFERLQYNGKALSGTDVLYKIEK